MKIAFCSSEVVPFAKTGGMADVCGTLPVVLEKLGEELVIVLPGYSTIDRKKFGFAKVFEDISRTVIGKNILVYLIENPAYFDRPGLYGDQAGDYPDNLERFDFYCRRTLELFKELKMKVDIVHCHDWQAALIPVYLKKQFAQDPFYCNTKTVLSLHNLAYQGVFPAEKYKKLPFGDKLFAEVFEFYGQANLLKAGILLSDVVSTVSPQYAKEIQTKEFGCGLEGVLLSRKKSIAGILNGLDYDYWNPATDPFIKFNYSAENPQPKSKDKADLQEKMKLLLKPRVPLFGFVSRLSHQKGIDLLNEAMGELMQLDLQLAFLGVGEEKYHRFLARWAKQYPDKVGVRMGFDEKFSHKIYAGSDLFLMPSVYEPCGLSQMISLGYGTIPLVYRTGGLVDTVVPYQQNGNGFVFTEYSKASFLAAVKKAIEVYREEDTFNKIIGRAFQFKFPWENSAQKYLELYSVKGSFESKDA